MLLPFKSVLNFQFSFLTQVPEIDTVLCELPRSEALSVVAAQAKCSVCLVQKDKILNTGCKI